jgi:hypothetical protein
MATSNVSICNLALQKLGESSITSLSDNDKNARAMNACFEAMRDAELRAYQWKFAKKRATLAPSSTVPDFGFALAFPVPADFLRLIKWSRLGSDWVMENHEGQNCILTNDGDTLEIRYLAKITDPTLYDPIFVEMLACKLAWHCCEQITQSNTKQGMLMDQYKFHRAEARKANAFEVIAQPQPLDTWLASRSMGTFMTNELFEE